MNHPWTTGAPALVYSTEAILWGPFLEQHVDEFPADEKIKVAALVINNDFGKLYDASFRAASPSRPSSRTGSTTRPRRSSRRRRRSPTR